MQIAIGSTNPVKRKATENVLSLVYPAATFITLAVESGVSETPWGDQETRQGALNRAQAVLKQTDAAIGVGLEGGIQEIEFGLFTCAWSAIVDRQGRVGIGGSSCVKLPGAVVQSIRQGVGLGDAIDRLSGQSGTRYDVGAIGTLTNGLATRQSAYEELLKMALATFVRPQWY